MSLHTGTEQITIWSNQAIGKNASVESAAIYLGKLGPNARFWGDINATCTGGVTRTTVTYKVGNASKGTFYTPGNATACCINHDSGTASRERYQLAIMGTPWARFKAKEQNASHETLNFDLIISQ